MVAVRLEMSSLSCACDLCPVMSDTISGGHIVFNDFSQSVSLLCPPCCELSRRMFDFLLKPEHLPHPCVVTKFLKDDLNKNGLWAEYFGKTLSHDTLRDAKEECKGRMGAQLATRMYVAYKAGIMKHPCVQQSKKYQNQREHAKAEERKNGGSTCVNGTSISGSVTFYVGRNLCGGCCISSQQCHHV